MGSGGAPGMVTDDSVTLCLYNLESEVVGGACGAADRGGVSQNGSNKYEGESNENLKYVLPRNLLNTKGTQ